MEPYFSEFGVVLSAAVEFESWLRPREKGDPRRRHGGLRHGVQHGGLLACER